MASVTRENIGKLTDKLTVNLSKEDYLQSFEKSLKQYAKNANIPGFRKGMVPAGLVKKMYGQSVFTDEILRTVEKELNNYMVKEQLDIFAQPLPLKNDARTLDVNNPGDYAFAFEIGLKPDFKIDTDSLTATVYKVNVTDEMINDEANRLQMRHGNMTEPEAIDSEENALNLDITEVDENGAAVTGAVTHSNSLLVKYFSEKVRNQWMGLKKGDSLVFKLSNAFEGKELDWLIADLHLNKSNAGDTEKYFRFVITKVGFIEKAELNETFFETAFPGRGIKTEEEFRNAIKVQIENHFDQQSKNQVHDQIYHQLIDNTPMEFPEDFLKRWLTSGAEKPKTEEEAQKELPTFMNQLKWTLISSNLINEHKIAVDNEEIKHQAVQQMLGYMGIDSADEAPWLEEYANRMLQDKKFVENTYFQLQSSKLFNLLASQIKTTEEAISAEAFNEKLHHHHH